MKTFLQQVAADLYQKYGNNLSGITIVFPGKRAAMWMNDNLFQCAQGPVWAPRYMTIDELFLQFSELQPSDPIRNVCTLYKIYEKCVPNPLSPDDFYGWGEILMNDFEDIDKHLVEVNKLFSNVHALQAMESTDFLDDKQIETLRDFFIRFSPEQQTEMKKKFLEMWEAMPQMYAKLKETLRTDGLMYKGAIYREVAEALKDEKQRESLLAQDENRTYVFVGFNVLDDVEETLFTVLQQEHRALFYWDCDNYYTKEHTNNEAGLFLRENLKKFPNSLPEEDYDNLMGHPKTIRYVATSTDNAQVRFLPQWLGEKLTQEERDSAVVLCDESLMRPVLHSIPSQAEDPKCAPKKPLNVTMGFPLTDTPVYGFFRALLDLQIDGWDINLYAFHPTALERVQHNALFSILPAEEQTILHENDNLALLDWLQHIMKLLGAHYAGIEQPTIWEQLYSESTFQIYRTLTQFHKLVTEGVLLVKSNTLRRLMLQMLSQASVPFHGEESEGMQIMGLLETRNLDFSHLLLLSVGEGILPKKANDVSLIPYCLRGYFGLSTIERKISVFAYYFYRIIQRAEDITIVYNENSAGTTQREMSRFLRQLLAETNLPIQCIRLTPKQKLNPVTPVTVEKDEEVMQRLEQRFDCASPHPHNLSPSAINTYLTCPLKFYYQQVAGIRMPDRPQDGIDNAHFGTLFHDTCELFYRHLAHKRGDNHVTQADLEPYTENKGLRLEKYLDAIFWVDYFHPELKEEDKGVKAEELLKSLIESTEEDFARQVRNLYDAPTPQGKRNYFTGINMIIREVLLSYLVKLLELDMETAGDTYFQIIAMETDCTMQLEIKTPDGKKREIRTGGRIDRLDYIPAQQAYRIVDYKTTTTKTAPANLEAIFQSGDHGADHYFLQTMLYSLAMCDKLKGRIQPALLYIPSVTDPEHYNPVLKFSSSKERVDDFRELASDYRAGLQTVVARIFNTQEPFTQTDDEENSCKYCDFIRLCGRRIKKQ